MSKLVLCVTVAAGAMALSAACVLASQGPGVGAGSASPLLQSVVALFIAGLGAIVVVGLVALALGAKPRD